MRRPTRQPGEGNCCPAAATGLAGLAVNPKFLLIVSLLAVAAEVIADRGAARMDGAVQHFDNRPPKRLGLSRRRIAASLCGVQPSFPQRFVGVNVADAADQRLVEQGALDAGLAGPHPRGQPRQVESFLKRVRPLPIEELGDGNLGCGRCD